MQDMKRKGAALAEILEKCWCCAPYLSNFAKFLRNDNGKRNGVFLKMLQEKRYGLGDSFDTARDNYMY